MGVWLLGWEVELTASHRADGKCRQRTVQNMYYDQHSELVMYIIMSVTLEHFIHIQ